MSVITLKAFYVNLILRLKEFIIYRYTQTQQTY